MKNQQRLRVFVAVALARSITRAAETLEISQPAVSRHIRLLENSLGCALFRRHGRGIELTHDGQRLLDVAAPALSRIDAICGQLKLSSQSVSGRLTIASVHTLNQYFLVPLLTEVLKTYPDLSINLLERSSLDVGNLVERGLADIGLAYDSMVTGDNLRITRLHDETMQVFHAPSMEDEITQFLDSAGRIDLAPDIKIIIPPSGYALRQLMDLRMGARARHVLQVETVDMMLQSARAGLGVCVLPKNLPPDMIEERGLVRKDITAPDMTRTVVLIMRPESETIPAVAHTANAFAEAALNLKDK
jgi:DNA-binding transcriptional LysR family regulator